MNRLYKCQQDTHGKKKGACVEEIEVWLCVMYLTQGFYAMCINS